MSSLTKKWLERGSVSPRALRRNRRERRELLGLDDDVADNGNVAGAVGVDHINRNGRMWPAGSAVKRSNNTQPKLQAKENEQTFGDWYSGRSSRP